MNITTSGNHRPQISEILDRAPPFDHAAERNCLGSILIGGRSILAEVVPIVRPSDFHDGNHRAVASVLWAMHVAGEEPDATLVASRAKLPEETDPAYFVMGLADSVGVAAHGPKYAGIVARKSKQRALIRAATDAIARVHEDDDPEIITADLGEELSERIEKTRAPKFVGISCAELASAKHSVSYLVDGVLAADQPGIIGGLPKLHKTTIAIDMAVSMATGEPFLGHFEIPRQSRVMYFSGEGGVCFLQDVARRVCRSKHIQLEDVDNLLFCDRLPRLDSADDLRQLGDFLADNETDAMFADPVYLAMAGADAGNVLSMGERLGAVNEVCVQAGVTPILLHHLKKNRVDASAPPELTDLSWSGFSEFAGQWVLLSRRTPYTPNPQGRHELLMSVGGRNGHSGLYGIDVEEGVTGSDTGRYWQVDVFNGSTIEERRRDAAENARQTKLDERIASDSKKIVSAMLRYPEGETPKTIRDTAGLSGTRYTEANAKLIQDGDVVPCEVKKPNRATPYDGFKLVEDTHP